MVIFSDSMFTAVPELKLEHCNFLAFFQLDNKQINKQQLKNLKWIQFNKIVEKYLYMGDYNVKCSLINCSLERAMAFIVTRNKVLQKSNLFLLFSYLFFIMYHANQIRLNTGIYYWRVFHLPHKEKPIKQQTTVPQKY